MQEAEPETILIRDSRPQTNLKPNQPKTWAWTMLRPSIMALMGITVLFAGWGAWRYFGASSNLDDSESIAELDGFESAAPLLGAPVADKSVSDNFGNSTLLSAPVEMMDSLPPLDAPIGPVTIQRTRTDEVWLTGTIEDDDASDRIALPPRISGGPNDSSTLR